MAPTEAVCEVFFGDFFKMVFGLLVFGAGSVTQSANPTGRPPARPVYPVAFRASSGFGCLGYAPTFGDNGSSHVLNTPPHLAITVHHTC